MSARCVVRSRQSVPVPSPRATARDGVLWLLVTGVDLYDAPKQFDLDAALRPLGTSAAECRDLVSRDEFEVFQRTDEDFVRDYLAGRLVRASA